MKVNMTPNPLDVVTIHASQGDTEARQWEFELHNNGELIDTSDVKEQLVFKAYKGGTEQLLPENTSTPTTSPFLGDIKYPQGLLTDQEFTYRQSPTEEDGLAKITDIKGNTIVWNQLVPPLSSMSAQNGTISVSDDVATVTSSSSTSYIGIATSGSSIVLPKGEHKYLLTVEVNSSKALSSCNLWYGNELTYIQRDIPANTWTKVSTIVSSYGEPTGQYVQLRGYGSFEQGDTLQVKNWNIFDLTAMGLDSLTEDEFASLFPLSYDYNTGSLLSFNGNGIKTVGFNQWDEEWEVGAYNSADGSKVNISDRIRNKNPIRVFPSVAYYKTKGLQVYYYDANMNYLGRNSLANLDVFTPPSNACYMNFNGLANSGTTYNNDICINISDPSKNGTYEPYTSSTLFLPISTYFPTGMKSAGSVYDELTPRKAITRIGAIDLGTLGWNRMAISEGYAFVSSQIENMVQVGNVGTANVLCPSYTLYMSGTGYSMPNDKTYRVGGSYFGTRRVIIRDDSYTDATAFKTAMNGIPLYYELATPTETSFTTASLVTENAEIPLSNEDGTLIGKCTEELSAEPGFHDAKIKLSDSDGTCYSNKLQLHVERSPQ